MKRVTRILWNRRPGPDDRLGCIDEVVIHDAAVVHVEQMDDRCWWIGITRPDGTGWMGNFTADRYGRMRFTEQANEGIAWDIDQTHERSGA